MKHSVFMHMSVLTTTESACVFTSYHTPLLLTPTSSHWALIPPQLPGFPLFTHSSLWGWDLYILCIHSTGNNKDGRQCMSWKSVIPVAVSQVWKPAEKKVNMDYYTARGCEGSRYRNNTHETWCENEWVGKGSVTNHFFGFASVSNCKIDTEYYS